MKTRILAVLVVTRDALRRAIFLACLSNPRVGIAPRTQPLQQNRGLLTSIVSFIKTVEQPKFGGSYHNMKYPTNGGKN